MIEDKLYETSLNWLRKYINDNCIVRGQYMKGKVPGTNYTWCFYLRRGLYNPEFNKHLAVCFLYKIKKEVGHFDFQLSGLETAATPMVTSLPIYAKQLLDIDLHSFIFRKAPKEYGLEEPWEGTPKFDTPTLLVDDLANSTMSLKICSDICRNYEIQKLNYAFVIVNKVNRSYYDMGLPEEQYSKSEHELRQKHDMYLDPNTTIISLFDMDEFNLKGASH
jgi:orotate phosphoribosyltransferase|tara:strand:+ start:956 stop:1615 length:660 start_codon:yes stop_codon:yes gene_type:complete